MKSSPLPRDPVARARALADQLRTIPVRNARVTVAETSQGLRATVPLEYKGVLRAALGVLRLRDHRTYELDDLGRAVWEQLDGRRTIGEVIDEFMAAHQLTFFEARGLVGQYLAQLTQRGLVALVAPRSDCEPET